MAIISVVRRNKNPIAPRRWLAMLFKVKECKGGYCVHELTFHDVFFDKSKAIERCKELDSDGFHTYIPDLKHGKRVELRLDDDTLIPGLPEYYHA